MNPTSLTTIKITRSKRFWSGNVFGSRDPYIYDRYLLLRRSAVKKDRRKRLYAKNNRYIYLKTNLAISHVLMESRDEYKIADLDIIGIIDLNPTPLNTNPFCNTAILQSLDSTIIVHTDSARLRMATLSVPYDNIILIKSPFTDSYFIALKYHDKIVAILKAFKDTCVGE